MNVEGSEVVLEIFEVILTSNVSSLPTKLDWSVWNMKRLELTIFVNVRPASIFKPAFSPFGATIST